MITLPTLDEVAPDDIVQAEDQLTTLLGEASSTTELARGFVHDINLYLGAVVAAVLSTAAEQIITNQSLSQILADPALADTAVVDQVLSNYNITRQTGTAAVGQITVVLDALVPVVIPLGNAFTIGTSTFATVEAISVRTGAATVTSATDLVLTPVGDGTYSFAVPVTATLVGASGAAKRGALATPLFVLPHFIEAYATADFGGGADIESNAALVARQQTGIAAPTFSNRSNLTALVAQSGLCPTATQLSFIGAGDAEMLRDKHTIFPIAQFGRTDVYARTSPTALSVALSKTATLVGTSAAGSTWQFAVAAGDVPGFYEVDRVALPAAPANDTGFQVTSDVRGVDLSAPGWKPDLVSPIEGVYSPFQTAVIQFLDTKTSTAGLTVGTSTAPYSVSLRAMPQIADLQTYLSSSRVRPLGGDVLVKAAVPCFLNVNFTITQPALVGTPDIAGIQTAVAVYINSLSFQSTLHASSLAVVIGPFLSAGASVGAIDVFGRIRRPDGTNTYIRDPFSVATLVPYLPQVMTTGQTVSFLLDPNDVSVGVTAGT